MQEKKEGVAPQHRGTVSQALQFGITEGKNRRRGAQKNSKAVGVTALLLMSGFAHILVLDMSIAGPPSCKRKGKSTLGCVALVFVNPKSILETNNGLGVNLTNPAFRQAENLTNFSKREFFVVI